MLIRLKQLNPARRNAEKTEENGFTIAEIMIAAVVMLIVLVSAAYGLANSVKSTSYVENFTKATQLANQQIAIAKQAPYRQLWIERETDPENIASHKCNPTGNGAPVGNTWAITGEGDQYAGLEYCVTKRFGATTGVGATYYIQTEVAYILTGVAYDSSSVGSTTPTRYFAKRVTVTVRWSDVQSASTEVIENNYHEIQQTYTRTPGTGDCVPDIVNYTGVSLPGCAP